MITSFNLGGNGGGGESSKVFRFNFPRGSWVKDDELAESVREHYRNGETVIGVDSSGKEYIVSEVKNDGTYFEFVNIYKATSDHKVYVNSYILWSNNIFSQETTRTLAQYDDLNGKADKTSVYTKEETYNKEEVDALISPKTPNVVKFGELEIEDGVMSNFSSTNYAQFPFLMDLTDKAFEINMEITTSGNVTTQQNILDSQDGLAFAVRNSKFVLAVSNNGSSWAFEAEGGVVESNTTYLIKLSWNRLVYKVLYSTDNGSNWNEAISQAYSGHPYPRTMIIGKDTTNSYIYSGVINLNKCTLSVNNQYVWDGMTDAGLLTRLATDLSNIDSNGVEYINTLIDNKLNPIATRLQNILGDN